MYVLTRFCLFYFCMFYICHHYWLNLYLITLMFLLNNAFKCDLRTLFFFCSLLRPPILKCFSLCVFFVKFFIFSCLFFNYFIQITFLVFFFNLKFKDMHSSNSHLLYYYTYYFLFLFAHPFSSIMHTLYFVVVFSKPSCCRVARWFKLIATTVWNEFQPDNQPTKPNLAKTATDGCDDGKSQRRLRYIYFLDFLRPLAVYALLVYKHTQSHTHVCAHVKVGVVAVVLSTFSLTGASFDVYVMLLVLSVILLFQRVIVLFLLLFGCVSCFFSIWNFADDFVEFTCRFAVLFTCPLASKQADDDPLLHTH